MRMWHGIVAMGLAIGQIAPGRGAPPAEAVRIDHVAIQAADLDRSAAFYKDLFGLAEVPAPFPGARWLALGGGVLLHIVSNQISGRTAPATHSRWDHLALATADMSAMIARLDVRHIAWASMDGAHRPQVRPDGVAQIFIQDPDGYWIEINDALKRPL